MLERKRKKERKGKVMFQGVEITTRGVWRRTDLRYWSPAVRGGYGADGDDRKR